MTPLPHSVSCWNLAGLSERVAKETVNEINLQFHVRRLREKQDSKPAVYRANIQICNLFVSCICAHIQNSDRWKRSCEAFFKKKNRKSFSVWVVQLVSAMSWHWGMEYKTDEKQFWGTFWNTFPEVYLMGASFSMKTQTNMAGVRNFIWITTAKHENKKPAFNPTGNQQQQ